MTATTPSLARFSRPRHSFLFRGGLIILFWALAAAAVVASHDALEPISVAGAAAVKILTIVVASWLYIRLTAPDCTVDHALFVGIVWLLLDIAAEVATTSHLGRGWFDLIGSPRRPALRDLLLVTWIGAPALFARIASHTSIE